MPASFKHLTDRKVSYNSLLARWKDGLYYTAVLTKCDRANNRCRICFEDGSEVWLSNRDLHIQISLDQLNEDDDIVCCVCDDGNSDPPNEIILCDVCNQGYHQKCHQPPVDASKLDDSEETKDHKDWFCATCSYILNQTNRAKLSATVAAAQQRQAPPSTKSTGPTSPKQPRLQTTSVPAVATQSQQQSKTKQPPVAVDDPIKSTKVTTPSAATNPTTSSSAAAIASNQSPIIRQAPKVKQTPTISQQQSNQKSTSAPTKPGVGHHPRSAPYYPLSNQVRAAVTSSSTAALASMTASSALVVGSSAGRSKQDLVKQSNKSSQRLMNNDSAISSPPDGGSTGLHRHAVRKSCVNYVTTPIKQSALPTATRSAPSLSVVSPGASGVTMCRDLASAQTLSTTSHSSIAKPIITMTMASTAPTVTSQAINASYTITALTSQSKTIDASGTKSLRNDDSSSANNNVASNGQIKEPRSVISTLDSLRQISDLSSPGVIESNPRAISMVQARAVDRARSEVNDTGDASSHDSVTSSQQKADSTQQVSASMSNNNVSRSSIPEREAETTSTTGTSNNNTNSKHATVIVGGTIE